MCECEPRYGCTQFHIFNEEQSKQHYKSQRERIPSPYKTAALHAKTSKSLFYHLFPRHAFDEVCLAIIITAVNKTSHL
jgi:hypothetical protein